MSRAQTKTRRPGTDHRWSRLRATRSRARVVVTSVTARYLGNVVVTADVIAGRPHSDDHLRTRRTTNIDRVRLPIK